MATQSPKQVAIALDRERHLLLDFNALCAAEELTGRNFMDEETWNTLSARDVRALLFACLKHEDPTLTLEMVGKMLGLMNAEAVSEALLKSRQDNFPEASEADPLRSPARRSQRSTSPRAGRSRASTSTSPTPSSDG